MAQQVFSVEVQGFGVLKILFVMMLYVTGVMRHGHCPITPQRAARSVRWVEIGTVVVRGGEGVVVGHHYHDWLRR